VDPRAPLLHRLLLPRPPFRCPAARHPDAPIVRFARVAGCSRARRNGLQSSGPTFAVTHHGAVNSASRKTPPVNLTTRSTSDSASIGRQFVLFRRLGQTIWRPGHSAGVAPGLT
jgi:hypothetical protein